METSEKIKELLNKEDYVASVDLTSAYHAISIHESSRRFLAFEFDNNRYVYNVLPFGLTSSPRIFTKMLFPVISFLRTQGVIISAYLDDILIINKCKWQLESDIKLVLDLLKNLGFHVNLEKSSLTPSKVINHLGYEWNTRDLTIAVPEAKSEKIRNFANKILSTTCTVKDLASFLGVAVSIETAFRWSPCFYRFLQLQYCQLIRTNVPWENTVTLNERSWHNLVWWSTCPKHLEPKSLKPPVFNTSMHCDASKTGWGGYLSSGTRTSGLWTDLESEKHINLLEFQAVFLCIRSFVLELENLTVQIFSDNITTVFYLNNIGGTRSPELCEIALQFWDFANTHKIQCIAHHVPGIRNSLADSYSRNHYDRHEYTISNEVFNSLIANIPFKPTIDLFASRLNHKLPIYSSYLPDPYASYVDSFSFPWKDNSYIFPPIPLIAKVMKKIISESINNVLLITPAWSGLTSLPVILPLLISNPIYIDNSHVLGQVPTRHRFSLIAWPISCNIAASTSSQDKLPSQYNLALGIPHWPPTNANGTNFISLLNAKGIAIQYLQL